MPKVDKHLYQFGPFQLNVEQRQLLRNGDSVEINEKTFDLLALLVQNHGRIVTKEEILEKVWHGVIVGEANIPTRINEIRKVLGKKGKKGRGEYIKTRYRLGYQFVATVRVLPPSREEEQEMKANDIDSDPDPTPDHPIKEPMSAPRWSGRRKILASTIIALALVAAVWWYRKSVEAKVRHTVQDSQMIETLQIYTNPEGFDQNLLDKHWLSEKQGGIEITKVKATIEKLRCEETRYGKDAKLERFDFRYVRVSSFGFGKSAIVGTSESWYLPKHKKDGSRVQQEAKNEHMKIAPEYELRKVGSSWLIVRTDVPRRPAQPCPSPSPTPALSPETSR